MIQGVAAKWSFSSLSADKGVNQVVTRFTPFITPQNFIVLENLSHFFYYNIRLYS